MKNTFKLLVTFCCAGLLFSVGCKKEQKLAQNSKSSVVASIGEDLQPTIYNDMLYFTDEAQFSGYMASLSQMISDSTDTTREDVKLDLVENSIGAGFMSLRKSINQQIDAQASAGWAHLEDVPDHFIKSTIFRSVLSVNGDVRVGDKITHFVNGQLAATVNFDNEPVLAQLRDLQTTATQADLYDLVDDVTSLWVGRLDQELLVEGGHTSNKTTSNNTFVSIGSFFAPDLCHIPLKIEIDALQVTTEANGQLAGIESSWIINWGDGTAAVTVAADQGHDNSQALNVPHTYTRAGTYTVTFRPSVQGVGGLGTFTRTVVVPAGCASNQGDRVPVYTQVDGNANYVVKQEAWVHKGHNIWHSVMQWQGARTTCMQWQNNSWKKWYPGNTGASFNIDKKDASCNGSGTLTGSDNSSDYTKSVETWTTYSYNWDFLYTHHHITVSGTARDYDMTTTKCF